MSDSGKPVSEIVDSMLTPEQKAAAAAHVAATKAERDAHTARKKERIQNLKAVRDVGATRRPHPHDGGWKTK
jgi:hypothetical protein